MSTEIKNTEFAVVSADAVQEMHRKFMAGIEEKAAKAIPENTRYRDIRIEALKGLLIECARKDVKINRDELAELAKSGKKAISLRAAQVESLLHASMPSRSSYPSPKFSPAQKKDQAEAAQMRNEPKFVLEAFNGEERLYMRLQSSDSASPAQLQIAAFLEQKGYTITDYNKGYATDAAGKQQFKIGRLLKDDKELYKAFTDDSSRSLDSLLVVFSRNAEDIARMSTGRAWSSCMGSGGFNYGYVPADIQKGSLIAYLISEKDPEILNPLARILIKPCTRTANADGSSLSDLSGVATKAFNPARQDKVFVADKRYGIHNDGFSSLVSDFIEERLNNDVCGVFRLEYGLYADGIDRTVTRKDGPAIKNEYGDLEWWVKGRLHREDGPAIEKANGDKEWRRHGQRHREDGPAFEGANGTKIWYRNDQIHREGGPAVEEAEGAKKWYRNGELHCEDGPAIERTDGTKMWYLNNKCHREDGPAVIKADGTKMWYLNHQCHREDGPAIERADGTKEWCRNGQHSREDGPAIEMADGTRKWYRDGQLHREDGPAVEWPGGKRWYIGGVNLSKNEFDKWREQNTKAPQVSAKTTNLSFG